MRWGNCKAPNSLIDTRQAQACGIRAEGVGFRVLGKNHPMLQTRHAAEEGEQYRRTCDKATGKRMRNSAGDLLFDASQLDFKMCVGDKLDTPYDTYLTDCL